ncbi:hypothetical protein BD410DRAFT_832485 [Rickenella mellea]|uniref:Uncharacterized protein n=1 Tax=Rickenella mellea TaxID=50990 RepID=A0A4Y7PMM0_9AGAM|nr:hypothetical protein BD410DRAFT_832485 [Rickenella mellea]
MFETVFSRIISALKFSINSIILLIVFILHITPALSIVLATYATTPLWSWGATFLSILLSIAVTYPLRLRTIGYHHYVVTWAFICHTVQIQKQHVNISSVRTVTIPTWLIIILIIPAIVVFYVAEVVFHTFVSALNPRLGAFEIFHLRMWTLWRFIEGTVSGCIRGGANSVQSDGQLADGRVAAGSGAVAQIPGPAAPGPAAAGPVAAGLAAAGPTAAGPTAAGPTAAGPAAAVDILTGPPMELVDLSLEMAGRQQASIPPPPYFAQAYFIDSILFRNKQDDTDICGSYV